MSWDEELDEAIGGTVAAYLNGLPREEAIRRLINLGMDRAGASMELDGEDDQLRYMTETGEAA